MQQQQQQQQQQRRPKVDTMRPVVRNDPPGILSETSLLTNLANAPPRGGSGNLTLNRSSMVSSSLVQPTIVPPFSLMPSTSFDGVPVSIASLLRELSENSESVVLPSLVSSRFQRRKTTHKISIDQIKNSFRQQARSGDSFIGIYSVQERKVRMDVWAAARRKRTFKKNIKYAHRHDLAGGRQRIGGRFVKSKGDESSVQRQTPPLDLEIGTTRTVIVEELN